MSFEEEQRFTSIEFFCLRHISSNVLIIKYWGSIRQIRTLHWLETVNKSYLKTATKFSKITQERPNILLAENKHFSGQNVQFQQEKGKTPCHTIDTYLYEIRISSHHCALVTCTMSNFSRKKKSSRNNIWSNCI